MVISSFCRSCGEHFRVKKGVAIANPGLRVSGISEVIPRQRKESPGKFASIDLDDNPVSDTDSNAWLVNAEDRESGARSLHRPEEAKTEEMIGISAGAFFGLVDGVDVTEGPDDGEPSLGRQAQGREALAHGSMAALIGSQRPAIPSDPDKMPPNYVPPDQRRKREEPVPETKVRCFRCYHVQGVSLFAKSTQCERCSAYISLADYEIKTVKSHTLRTRGDVTIARKGGLINDSEIACHHLSVGGSIDARVDCTGEAVFRHSGVVRGNLFCARLVVEKGCEVRFPDGVMTERAEINGHLIGNITCSGKLRIGKSGVVDGDARAVEIDLKEGGRISGRSDVDPDTSTELPLRKGFNPTVIG